MSNKTIRRDMVRAMPEDGAIVVVNDSADLAHDSVLYVGSGGDLKVTTVGGSTLIFVGVVGGTVLPVKVKRVFDTNTTATNMVAVY